MRNIAVVTSNRSEYGLLKNTIKRIDNSCNLNLQLIITGSHLSRDYGETISEILEDDYRSYECIPIICNNSQVNQMSILMSKLEEVFDKIKPDIVLILGDRYEILSVASVALMKNIPLAHISGGERTEGIIDEQIRHAITKMSHIHFPGASEYANNIKNMGEEKWRIFNVGDPAIENIKNTALLSVGEISEKINFDIDENTILATFHPVTLESEKTKKYIENILNVLSRFDNKVIFTYPNSDFGSEIIIDLLLKYEKEHRNMKVVKNLGSRLYLSIMAKCSCIIGNSSSGIIEAPFFKKPVVNIGNRQEGRLMSDNIINCGYKETEIFEAIKKATSDEFKRYAQENTVCLYGDGNTSESIVKVLENIDINDKLLKKKLVW